MHYLVVKWFCRPSEFPEGLVSAKTHQQQQKIGTSTGRGCARPKVLERLPEKAGYMCATGVLFGVDYETCSPEKLVNTLVDRISN